MENQPIDTPTDLPVSPYTQDENAIVKILLLTAFMIGYYVAVEMYMIKNIYSQEDYCDNAERIHNLFG